MKIVQINSTCGVGSTGKICLAVSELLSKENIENHILYSYLDNGARPNAERLSSYTYVKLQALKAKVLGNNGFNSRGATKKMIAKLEEISPDVIHLHNIHSHDCDLKLLFGYLKGKNIKIFWTFHDCWAFTAYCHYFTMSQCDRWQTGCKGCPNIKRYSWTFDRSRYLYELKRELFSSELDITVITPSEWLAGLVKKSFFGRYPVKVINNGIDLSLFKPSGVERDREVRARLGCEGKYLVMGCSFDWDSRKGLDVFKELSERLGDDFRILLVGTNENIDKALPKNIISVHRTKDQAELAELYSASDLFVNPTREENYPTVNMEAVACGTPVLTFNTGGSIEMLDSSVGAWVDTGDIDRLEREIRRIKEDKPFSAETCVSHAKNFDMNERFREYIELYKNI